MDELDLEILKLAENWAREILRQDRPILDFEQKLMDAILIKRNITMKKLKIPPPAAIPKIETPTNQKTVSFNEMPTTPVPARLQLDLITKSKKNE